MVWSSLRVTTSDVLVLAAFFGSEAPSLGQLDFFNSIGGTDKLTAAGQELLQARRDGKAAKRLFSRSWRGPVVVCQIKMSYSKVERPEKHLPGNIERIDISKIVP